LDNRLIVECRFGVGTAGALTLVRMSKPAWLVLGDLPNSMTHPPCYA
jgi:hypothetical protein